MTGSSPAGPGAARYERVGAAAVIAIRRPQRRNAIDGPTAEAMVQAVRAFNDDPDARVLVVTGDEEAFCVGADLRSLESLRPRVGKPEGVFGVRRFPPKPAIAAISGWCLFGLRQVGHYLRGRRRSVSTVRQRLMSTAVTFSALAASWSAVTATCAVSASRTAR